MVFREEAERAGISGRLMFYSLAQDQAVFAKCCAVNALIVRIAAEAGAGSKGIWPSFRTANDQAMLTRSRATVQAADHRGSADAAIASRNGSCSQGIAAQDHAGIAKCRSHSPEERRLIDAEDRECRNGQSGTRRTAKDHGKFEKSSCLN